MPLKNRAGLLIPQSPRQSLRLPCQGYYIRPYLPQQAHGLRLVEVAGEADFVANLDADGDIPSVRGIGSASRRRNASSPPSSNNSAGSVGRKTWSGSYSKRAGLPPSVAIRYTETVAAQIRCMVYSRRPKARSESAPPLSAVPESPWRYIPVRVRYLSPVADPRQEPSSSRRFRWGISLAAPSPQRRGKRRKYAGCLRRQFAVLVAQVPAPQRVPLGNVNELQPTPAALRLAAAENPDVGSDAGVVKHIEGKGNDGSQPVVFDNPASDVAFDLDGNGSWFCRDGGQYWT